MLQPRSWRLGFAVFVSISLSLACGSGELRSSDSSADSNGSALTGSVILNEVLANEPGSDTTREFIEIVNTGSTSVDVGGWTLSDAVSVRHTFASGTSLGAGGAYVVFGSKAGVPTGLGNAVGASTGTLSLSNSGDTVSLKNATGTTLDSVKYTSTLAGKDGVSMNRNPDGSGSGTWVLHTSISSLTSSPGTRADGSAFGTNPPADAGHPDAGQPDAGQPTDGGTQTHPDGGLHLRVMEGNLTSGDDQSYDPGNGQRIFEGLHPDVTLIQEFNEGTNSDADIRAFVDTTWGTSFQYVRQSGSGIQIPNGVISRYPIISSGTWMDPEVSNRGFTWAQIQLPASHNLWAISLHLLTTNSSSRASEASALVSLIQANIPSGDFLVIGGDLNTSSRGEACITNNLTKVVVTTAPYPADGKGNSNTSLSRDKPHDWLMAKSNLAAFEIPVTIGGISYASGLVFDSRIFTPLSAVSPVLSSDSGASNMQHMGVVKDFLVP